MVALSENAFQRMKSCASLKGSSDIERCAASLREGCRPTSPISGGCDQQEGSETHVSSKSRASCRSVVWSVLAYGGRSAADGRARPAESGSVGRRHNGRSSGSHRHSRPASLGPGHQEEFRGDRRFGDRRGHRRPAGPFGVRGSATYSRHHPATHQLRPRPRPSGGRRRRRLRARPVGRAFRNQRSRHLLRRLGPRSQLRGCLGRPAVGRGCLQERRRQHDRGRHRRYDQPAHPRAVRQRRPPVGGQRRLQLRRPVREGFLVR